MTWTLASSATQTAVIGTEHALVTSTTNGTFIYEVDLTNLALGDVIELRIKGITLAAGAAGQMWKATYAGVQTNVRVQSMGIGSDISISLTLKQTAGTGRTFPWKLLSI